jgi:hypothetical protein
VIELNKDTRKRLLALFAQFTPIAIQTEPTHPITTGVMKRILPLSGLNSKLAPEHGLEP